MTISESTWTKYTTALRRISETAARKFAAYLTVMGDWQSEDKRRDVLDYAYSLATSYGEASAALACEMYDAIAEIEGASVPAAVPAATATYQETATAIQGAMKQSGGVEMAQYAVNRLVKQAGADTTLQNAKRDREYAEFAWIPFGDTCAFCLSLASNGWQTMSKDALKNGHADHIHQNCDCQYVVRFDSSSSVQGYDPDVYRRMYYDAPLRPGEAPTSANRINAMRREIYAENKDTINAQKRIAYAQKNARDEGISI